MPTFHKSRNWGMQPSGHQQPLRDFGITYLHNAACTDKREQVNGIAFEDIGSSALQVGYDGAVVNTFDGTVNTAYAVPSSALVECSPEFTAFALIKTGNSVTGGQTILSKFGDGALNDSWVLSVDSGVLNFHVNLGSTWYTATATVATLSTNSVYTVAGIRKGAQAWAAVNGVISSPVTLPSSSQTSSSSKLRTGRSGSSISTANFNGKIALTWLSKNSLSGLLPGLHDNPWQIFEPERKFFYINSELMLTLQGLTQSQNLDTTQLTQQSILSILGISQSQNLGTADLTQQNTLSPAGIIQTQSLGGIALTQQNSISLAGLIQAQTLGAIELTQQNSLSPTGVSQAQILDAFDLTITGGAASSIAVFSRPNTAQEVLEGPIIPKLNPAFSDMELCLLGGRKEGVGGPIRDFEFYEDCGFKTGTIGPGQGPLSATAEGAITFANSEKLKSGTLSGVAVFEFTTVPNYGLVFGTMFGYDPDYPLGGLDVYTLATGTVAMNQYEGSSAMVSSSSGKILARKPSAVAWSYNGSTGLAQLWVNGSYYSATTVRDTSTTNSTGALGGFKEGDLDGVGKKVFHLCAVWGRDMTPAEVISLGENPWQIFQPERKVFFLPQAELSLVPQGLSNTQQLDQPALTQQSLLSVNGAAQAQVLGALSLTQQNTISPSALTQSQVLGVISLVSQSTLAMNELSQSQTISAIALTQQGALAVTNMAQGQTLEGLSLAQQNLLSVAGANSAQNLSSPTLAFGAFLSVESAQQAQALGTISLVQQNILAVNGVASSQSLGSIALQQANVLSVQAQVQSQSLGVLDLVFQAYLAPNSIANSQTIDNLSLVQANILQVYGLSQDQLLESINLSQDSWLIVDDVLHQQIATNIHLLNGAAVLRVAGSIVYVLGSKAPVFVLNSSAKILVTAG